MVQRADPACSLRRPSTLPPAAQFSSCGSAPIGVLPIAARLAYFFVLYQCSVVVEGSHGATPHNLSNKSETVRMENGQ